MTEYINLFAKHKVILVTGERVTSAGLGFTYDEICESVQNFICGINLSEEILKANPDLEVTLELGLSETIEDAQSGKFIRVGDAYTYTVEELTSAFKGANVTLGTSLTVNYYVTLAENVAEKAKVVFTKENGDTIEVTPVKGTGVYEAYYVFSFTGITPQCMGDNIKAELYVNDKLISTKDDYSVKQNLANLKAKELNKAEAEKDTNLLALLDNTIAYGAAAQTYRNYKTDALVTKGWNNTTATQTPSQADSVLKIVDNGGKAKGVCFKSATVWFDNVNSIAFKYIGTADDVVVTVNGKTITCESFVQDDGVKGVKTPGISALQMGDVYTVELKVGGETVQTLTYSVKSYVYSQLSSTKETMRALAIALYNYGIAAEAYAGQFLSYTISVENGTMADGTTSAVCNPDAELTLKANTPETGYIFSHWENSAKEVLGTETTLTVTVADDETYTAVMVQNLTYRLNGGVYIVSHSDDWTGTDLVIPAMYKGVPVTSINQNGFKGVALTSVYVPEGVTYIGANAFDWIKDIKWVHIPSTLTMADNAVFPNAIGIVYYGGTEENWANINIRTYYNSGLTNAPRYYYSETQPTEDGKFWHYVDGVPTAW